MNDEYDNDEPVYQLNIFQNDDGTWRTEEYCPEPGVDNMQLLGSFVMYAARLIDKGLVRMRAIERANKDDIMKLLKEIVNEPDDPDESGTIN